MSGKAFVNAAICGTALLVSALASGPAAAEESYDLVFSTYLGGSGWEHARDVFADEQGNVYIVGGTASDDFPTTLGAFQRSQDKTGTEIGSLGYCDAFVAKFDPDGVLIWSTYLGGPNYDRAYAVEVDSREYVYVAGRAGPGFPVTTGVLQETFHGCPPGGGYGAQNCFVVKMEPDGSDLVWAGYMGRGDMCRDMAVDADGDIYLPLASGNGTDPAWFATAFSNAYQDTLQGGNDCGAVKVSNDGTRAFWATWLGGSADDSGAASIRAGADESVYIFLNTQSTDIPTTAGAHDRTHNGGPWDTYAARLSADGSALLYGTYLGGSQNEWAVDTHTLAVDPQGNAYLDVWTGSSDFPTTPGVFDRSFGGNGDIAIAKLSPTGALLMSTFIGGGSDDNSDGIYTDASGNVFFTGVTGSTDFPVTPNAYQSALAGDHDAVLVRLSADFSRLLYSTYMGGGNYDNGRSAYLHQDGSLYITGSVNGGGWPTWNAHQDFFAGGGGGSTVGYAGDNILAKFAPTPIGLLRDDSIGSIAPGSFDLTAILPLVNPDDLHIPAISPGDAETEPVIGDRARPLIFYSLTNDATLLLVKSPPDLLFFF